MDIDACFLKRENLAYDALQGLKGIIRKTPPGRKAVGGAGGAL
jgi:hypothetical protein